MKKLAILLTMVLVFGLATSATAAELSTSGYVTYGFEKVGDDKFFASFDQDIDWRVQLKATIDDTLSATLRFDDDGSGVAVQRAFFTKDCGVLSATVGKQWFSAGGPVGFIGQGEVGASVKVPFSVGTVRALVAPGEFDNPDLAFGADFGLAGFSLYGDLAMDYDGSDYVNSYAIEAEYGIGDFTIYGGVSQEDDDDDFDGKLVGASASVSMFDLCGEYDLAAETFYLNGETTFGGILYGLEYTSESEAGDDATIGGYAKVSF